ncbi:glycine receptor subunit alpha-2-like isoform X2 [Orbicella faveolata]|uniref:glycine receptor subunit alpha-2-like isoform X2 n=1 Tax=Orbicella faveolata TaxID=48498 RepID=UPI0009E4946B|nr:glycine receptor subunit alpha-2-like isoform X2 [Orbicella faveolata]
MVDVSFSFPLIILALLPKTLVAGYKETADELQQITNPEKYHKYLRPYHKGIPVNVTVGVTVIHFVAVREMSEEFSLDLVIRQQWKDARLNHSLNYTLTLPANSKKLIWLPDTFFLNVRSATIHDVISENGKVSINPGGLVSYSARITITAGCPMDLSDYPIDEQTCDLELSSYAYTENELDYNWAVGSGDDIVVKDKNLAELALTQAKAIKDCEYYADGTHSKLVARFWFKRRLGYAFLQIYIPTIMLVVLSWLSFWIPEDSVPARVALGSTTVLSVVTFTGSFRSSLPKVSYIKAVDVYFIASFTFVFAAVVEYVSVLLNTGLNRQRSNSGLYSSRNHVDVGNRKTNEYKEEGELHEVKVESPASENVDLKKHRSVSARTAKEYMQYAFVRNEASSIDRVSRVLFPCCYAIFNLIYWIYYELASFGNHSPA